MTPKEAWDAAYKRSAREVSGTSAEVFKSRGAEEVKHDAFIQAVLEQIIASLDLPYEDLAKDWRSSVDRDHRLRANQRWAAMTNPLPSEPAQPSPATFPYVPLTSPRPTGLTILTETPIGYGTGRGGR